MSPPSPMSLRRALGWMVAATALSLARSFGSVELIRAIRHVSIWLGLLLIVVWFATFIVPLVVVGWTIREAFRPHHPWQHLWKLLAAGGSIALCSAGLYYAQAAIGDHNDAVDKRNYYGNFGAVRPPESLPRWRTDRAFVGIEARLFTGVDWPEDELGVEYLRGVEEVPVAVMVERARGSHEEVVRFDPGARLVVFGDCLFLSVATLANLNTDIVPKHWDTKLTVATEGLCGLALIVVALGMVLGNWWEAKGQPPPPGTGPQP